MRPTNILWVRCSGPSWRYNCQAVSYSSDLLCAGSGPCSTFLSVSKGFAVVYLGFGLSPARDAITCAEELFWVSKSLFAFAEKGLELPDAASPPLLRVPASDMRLINVSVFGGYKKSSIGSCPSWEEDPF